MNLEWRINNATIVNSDSIEEGLSIKINNDLIHSIGEKDNHLEDVSIDIENYYILPGLINSHDHLMATYSPKVGSKKPYLNWLSWDNELKSSEVFLERQKLSLDLIYQLGSYKNIINGFTSVQDHIPHFVNASYIDKVRVKILNNYSLAHSICSYSLNWGNGLLNEFNESIEKNIPFITHIGEGFDDESRNAFQKMLELELLNNNTVLVHGFHFSKEDIKILKDKNVSVIWTPTSNLFLYNKTIPIKELLEEGVNICLGTDSCLSGSYSLKEEFINLNSYCSDNYAELISSKELFRMLTLNPSKAFKLDQKIGSIEKNKKADFLIFKKKTQNPYDDLIGLNQEDISLVIIDGIPVYGDINLKNFFDYFSNPFEIVDIKGKKKLLLGNLSEVFENMKQCLGYKKDLAFLPLNFNK